MSSKPCKNGQTMSPDGSTRSCQLVKLTKRDCVTCSTNGVQRAIPMVLNKP